MNNNEEDGNFSFSLDNMNINKVHNYKYLGFDFNDEGNMIQHLNTRILKA